MLKELQAFVEQHRLISKNDKIILAVSGGKDSICMTHLFHLLGYNFSIAHCNFKLRANDSDLDENFVRSLSNQLKVPFYSKVFDTKTYSKKYGISIQMAARDLRYQWFKSLSENKGFDKILTAHHQDDAIETLLIKKSRKSSLGALCGIPLKNKNIIRPMLCFGVQQIEDFLSTHSIEYREDKSNESTYYLRNSIRKELESIDAISRQNYLNEIENNKKKYSELIIKTEEYRKEYCLEVKGGTLLSLDYLLDQDNKNEILFECLKYYGNFSWKDVFALINADVGKYLTNSKYRIIRERKGLLSLKLRLTKKKSKLIKKSDCSIDCPIALKFTVSDQSIFEKYHDSQYSMLDYDKLHFPLELRKWKDGDYFKPIGMQGRKK